MNNNILLVQVISFIVIPIIIGKSKERHDATLKSIGNGLIITNSEGKIILLNKEGETITGWKEREVLKSHICDVINIYSNKEKIDFKATVNKVLQKGEEIAFNDVMLTARNKKETSINVRLIPVREQNGRIIGSTCSFNDITEQKENEKIVRYFSFHDKVTGLYNRNYLEEEMARLNVRRQLPISLIMADINAFKLTNDVFGHIKGDELLLLVAKILKKACREEDIIARWGGDEFVILLLRTSEESAARIARNIKKLATQESFDGIPVNISLGYAVKNNIEVDINDVLADAEEMMYTNKLDEGKEARKYILKAMRKRLHESDEAFTRRIEALQELAEKSGLYLGLTPKEVRDLVMLAEYHDIGRLAFPENIMKKWNRLRGRDYQKYKMHVEVGYRIAQSYDELKDIAEAILCHHERWNGRGYPRGLCGEEIPAIARAFSVIEAYYTFANDYRGRRELSVAEILKRLEMGAGTDYDPDMVEGFIKYYRSSGKNNQEEILSVK